MDKSSLTHPLVAVVLLIISVSLGAMAALLAAAVTIDNPLRASVAAGSIVSSVTLVALTTWWGNTVRDALGIERPNTAPEFLRLEVKMLDTGQLTYRRLAHVSPDALRRIAELVKAGSNITHATCAHLFANRREYSAFVTSLIDARYAEYRSPTAPQQGIRITDAGAEMLAALLTQDGDTAQNSGIIGRTHAEHALPEGEGWVKYEH